jgi:phosphatidylserine/phosphatidylglycerophosphate/cardiolipin synthase-like enzyme
MIRFLPLIAFYLALCLSAHAFPVQVGQSPDNTLALTVQAIRSAQKSLLINIYQFSSEGVAAAIAERIRAGVHVEILREGQTVEGLSAQELDVQARLAQLMRARGDGRIYVMTATQRADRRYRFDHAKYAVIDGESLLIGSENYTDTGTPKPTQKPRTANRGWQVWAHEPKLAAEFTAIFRRDADPAQKDIQVLDAPASAPAPTFKAARLAFTGETLDASGAETVLSPDNSQAKTLELIGRARRTLDIEHMGFPSKWGRGESPIIQAVLEAARRGARVRVLINPDNAFAPPGSAADPASGPETQTIDGFNRVARDEKLDLTAVAADLRAMGVKAIHNKGVLVDGRYSLVASINWTQTSVVQNREAGLILESPAIHAHYDELFARDWAASQAKAGPGRADATARSRADR